MLRYLKKPVFLLVFVTLLIAVLMILSINGNQAFSNFQGAVSAVVSPFQKGVYLSVNWVVNKIEFIKEMDKIAVENKRLKEEIAYLEQQVQKHSEVVEENKRLREILGLKDQFSQYDFIVADIISKDPGNWFDVFTVDKGSADGVKDNQPVISSNKLAGRVLQAGLNSSKIISIIDPDSSVSCILSRTRDLVVVRGDPKLKEQGLLRMNFILPEADIEVGDLVETSGMGGVYPKGILVGRVKEINTNIREGTIYALVEPAVDFKRLEEVVILKEKQSDQ